MIVIAGLLFGAFLGAFRARRRNGTGFDIAQYALAHGIFFGLVGLFAALLISRFG